MATRKTGSRPIVVDGKRYRWRVARSPTYFQTAYAHTLTFTVQSEDGGSVLLVAANGPRPDNWLERPGAVVTPVIVAGAIPQALAAGWRAETGGGSFHLALPPNTEPSTAS